MLTGPGLNWWTYGAPSSTPGGGDHYCARTSDSAMQGGQVDLRGWFIFLSVTVGSLLC